jgi:hypothetical protein
MDDANKKIWMADGWRWTIGSVNNFNITTDTQDYVVTIPADYLYTWRAYVTDGSTFEPLHVEPSLPTTAVIATGYPKQITKLSNGFRLFPRPGNPGVSTVTVVQMYKKAAPSITSGNASTPGALVMDDEWYHVYFEAVLYHAYKYAFDAHAGSAQYNIQTKEAICNGQLGILMAAIEDMRKREPVATEWDFRPERETRRK